MSSNDIYGTLCDLDVLFAKRDSAKNVIGVRRGDEDVSVVTAQALGDMGIRSTPSLRAGKKIIDWTQATNSSSSPLGSVTATKTLTAGVKTLFTGAPAASGVLGLSNDVTTSDYSSGDNFIIDVGFPSVSYACSFRVSFYTTGYAKAAHFLNIIPAGSIRYPRMQLSLPKGEATFAGGFVRADWENICYVEVALDKAPGTVTNGANTDQVELYSLWLGRREKTKVFFAIDDNNRQLMRFQNGYGNPKGLGITDYGIIPISYCIATQIGQASFETVENMRALYNAGWVFGVHGTTALVNPIASISWAGGVATVTTVFPHGFTTSDTATFNDIDPFVLGGAKVVTNTGANTLTYTTGVPGGTGNALGNMSVNWKAGSGNAIATSAAAIQAEIAALKALGFTRGLTHYALPNGAWSYARVTELEGLGFKNIRTTAGLINTTVPTVVTGASGGARSTFNTAVGFVGTSRVFSTVDMNESPALSLAGAVARKDMAIRAGDSIMYYGHTISVLGDIVASNVEWENLKFWSLLDAIVADRAQGLLDTPSMVEEFG